VGDLDVVIEVRTKLFEHRLQDKQRRADLIRDRLSSLPLGQIERHGDDHGVNLSRLRALANRLRTQQELACQLWETGDASARLLAILICRPKAFDRDQLDVMLREARTPKLHDWLVNYVVKKNPHR